MIDEKEDLELRNLNQYTGSENVYRIFLGALATEGIIYIMENGYSWFVTDALSVIAVKFPKKQFLIITLNVNNDKTADMIIKDEQNRVLYKQHYEWTDAKRNLKLFYVDGVIMLSSEY